MAKDKSSKKKSKGGSTKKLKVDFREVEKDIRKRSKKIPENDYLAKITKAEVKKNKDGDGRHILWTLQVIEDKKGGKKYAGTPMWTRTSLKPQALFSLRNLIFAATDGKKNVAGKVADIDLSAYIGKKVAITNEWDERDGKLYNSVADIFPPSQLVADDEDDEDEDDDDESDESDEDDEDEDDDEEDEDDDDEDDEDEDEDDDEDDLDDVDDDDL